MKEVKPVYPDIARQAGIEGIVSMRVVINKDGAVEKVEVLSGEEALRQRGDGGGSSMALPAIFAGWKSGTGCDRR